MTSDTDQTPASEPLALFTEAELAVDDVAFDEMNIVEMPIALLSRSTSGIYEIPLSADGESRLVCANSTKHGLPNSLAPRVLLGLMWYWKKRCNPEQDVFTVKLRELVTEYMYPDKFKAYPPGSELLRSVERQLNCIANTRIHTNRWYDIQRRMHVKDPNIQIIGDVVTIDEGGRNRARVLEITWGKHFWRSMKNHYTKGIDARIVQRLDKPLDLQLYRLLDRQLSQKPRQSYVNIVNFARFKLGMQGQKLDAGGRTASSYVARCLQESLTRLSAEQFSVRMTIDRSADIYSVTFERLEHQPERPHEVADRDQPAQLIAEFARVAHSVPAEHKRSRIARADRALAVQWIELYGLDKATWMVGRCVALQRERRAEPILLFRGLKVYEDAAAGSYERCTREQAGQLELEAAERWQRQWRRYCEQLRSRWDSSRDAQQREQLAALCLAQVRAESSVMREAPEALAEAAAASRLTAQKLEQMDVMPELEFAAHRSLDALRDALRARHGFDLDLG